MKCIAISGNQKETNGLPAVVFLTVDWSHGLHPRSG